MSNRGPETQTPQQINLMIVVNSETFEPDQTIFPAVQALVDHKMISKVGIVDLQDNKELFLNFDANHAGFLNVRFPDNQYTQEKMHDYHLHKIKPSDFHVGWFRMDTPAGYDLDTLFNLFKVNFGIPFFNNLDGMLEYGSKAKLIDLQKKLVSKDGEPYIPASAICGCITSIKMFQDKIKKDIVVKSFFGAGGKEVHRMNVDGTSDFSNDEELSNFIQEVGGEVYVQEFIKMDRITDDRIIVMFDPETGDMKATCALRRVAKEGQWKANIAQGGVGEVMEMDERHHELAEAVGLELINAGIYMAGIDVLYDADQLDDKGRDVPKITEINVRNVGGIAETSEATGIDYMTGFIDSLCYLFVEHGLVSREETRLFSALEEEIEYLESDATKH